MLNTEELKMNVGHKRHEALKIVCKTQSTVFLSSFPVWVTHLMMSHCGMKPEHPGDDW